MDHVQFAAARAALLTYFDDQAVDELLLSGSGPMWLEACGVATERPSPFPSAEHLLLWVQEVARRSGLRLDPLCGSAGGSLRGDRGEPQHLRWHCLLKPLAQEGPLFSLRRHRFEALALADFDGPSAAARALAAAAAARSSLLLVGPTGSGKTSMLAALLREFAAAERVVLVEALAELPPLSPRWVRLLERRANLEGVGAVGLTRLVQEALRLRPDRLVIGEIRGPEAGAFVEALLSGHGGVMATLHAGSVDEGVARLSALAVSAGWRGVPWAGVALTVAVLARGAAPGERPRLAAVETVVFAP